MGRRIESKNDKTFKVVVARKYAGHFKEGDRQWTANGYRVVELDIKYYRGGLNLPYETVLDGFIKENEVLCYFI